MSEDSGLYTCEICGEGQLSATAVRTHMYRVHINDEVACMFCDLRGVTAEEMTLHINAVHCFDDNPGDCVGCPGSQRHLNGVQCDTEKQSMNQIQAARLRAIADPISMHHDSDAFVNLVDSDDASDQMSNRSFSPKYIAAKGSCQSADSACVMNRDRHQKRKFSDSSVASSSCSGQEETDLPPLCVCSYSNASITRNGCTSLSECSASSSQRLPKTAVANHVDQAFQNSRFLEKLCLNLYIFTPEELYISDI